MRGAVLAVLVLCTAVQCQQFNLLSYLLGGQPSTLQRRTSQAGAARANCHAHLKQMCDAAAGRGREDGADYPGQAGRAAARQAAPAPRTPPAPAETEKPGKSLLGMSLKRPSQVGLFVVVFCLKVRQCFGLG